MEEKKIEYLPKNYLPKSISTPEGIADSLVKSLLVCAERLELSKFEKTTKLYKDFLTRNSQN